MGEKNFFPPNRTKTMTKRQRKEAKSQEMIMVAQAKRDAAKVKQAQDYRATH